MMRSDEQSKKFLGDALEMLFSAHQEQDPFRIGAATRQLEFLEWIDSLKHTEDRSGCFEEAIR